MQSQTHFTRYRTDENVISKRDYFVKMRGFLGVAGGGGGMKEPYMCFMSVRMGHRTGRMIEATSPFKNRHVS